MILFPPFFPSVTFLHKIDSLSQKIIFSRQISKSNNSFYRRLKSSHLMLSTGMFHYFEFLTAETSFILNQDSPFNILKFITYDRNRFVSPFDLYKKKVWKRCRIAQSTIAEPDSHLHESWEGLLPVFVQSNDLVLVSLPKPLHHALLYRPSFCFLSPSS